MTTHIDHAEYPKSLKIKSDAQLRFIIRDAFEAEKANPTGPKAGFYLDEINYAQMELRSRLYPKQP